MNEGTVSTNQAIASVPYSLSRVGVLMSPDSDRPFEAEGVLNPAAAWGPDERPYLFPRLVSEGNRSRVGRAEILLTDGIPTGVERDGVVLAPDRSWERGTRHGGVEDPRVTWLPSLGRYLMAYVAYGPLGPRAALAVSTDTVTWERLGPIQFGYVDALDTDLNLFPNKDLAWFPEIVPDPDGVPSYALIHRPMFELDFARPDEQVSLPRGVTDERAAIWISYVPAEAAQREIGALCHPKSHRVLATAEQEWESLKIGGGAPPVRVDEGWLLIYHGVSGSIGPDPFTPQRSVFYAAGAMLLDAEHPERVLARTTQPLLSPELAEERVGIVGNVVFPTATLAVEGNVFVFYGMADQAIGVARLDRVADARR